MPIRQQKILAVTCDRRTGQFFLVNLAKFGYTVLIAKNAAQGLALAKSSNPAIVICESCPNISDALNFCHTLRTDKELQAAPIILLASDIHPELTIAAWRHGVDTVLTKPVSIRMLIANIESSRRRIEQISASSMQTDAANSKRHVNVVDSYFNGSIAFLPIVELLQFLHYSKKSGTLVLTGQGVSGTIEMRTGEVIYAQTGDVHGENAVYRMASWHTGGFSFHEKITTCRPNISQSTMKLILECCTGINSAEPHLNLSHKLDRNTPDTSADCYSDLEVSGAE